MDGNPIGFRAGCFGTHSLGGSPKSWGARCWVGPNPSLLREKLGVVSSFSSICPFAGGWVYGKIVSPPLLPISVWGFLRVYLVYRSCSASFWLSKGLVPCVAVGYVCLWEEEPAMLPSWNENLEHTFKNLPRIILTCFQGWESLLEILI